MRLSRRQRIFATLIAFASVLFSQLAIAAYVCTAPDVGIGQRPSSMAMAMMHEAMPDCEHMAEEQSPLCHAHCQADSQSADKPPVPNPTPFVAALLIAEISHREPPAATLAESAASLRLRPDGTPPISIRNCCFRI